MQLHPQTTTTDVPTSSLAGSEPVRQAPRSRLKRRLMWTGAMVALVLLLIFVPPLVNANRYRLKIAQSMSASLGRPVHLDNVSLHLLPMPGLTLSNLVVSEDPAFGDEPTLRADSVEATLRLPSLWRRRVEFSTVRFIEPHVNLVRNSQGKWNLADVLLHASRVDTAPTAQRHAGPTPRFPYIEATGGRVNIKLAEEKLPFAITDADFALWLPSPRQWSVRLTGQPARTDMDITDPGTVRLEGDLQRATAAGVPVNIRASWHDAPMGEASRLISGEDLGWRGTLNLDGHLVGTLDDAQVSTKLTLGGLRRADFAPAHPLNLQITCGSGISVVTVTLTNLRCTMPDDAPVPMILSAGRLNLQHPEQADATITAQEIPIRWPLLWAALFSPRVPTDLHPTGKVALSFEHLPGATVRPSPAHRLVHARRLKTPAAAAEPAVSPWNGWTGLVQVSLPAAPRLTPTPATAVAEATLPLQLMWRGGEVAGPAGSPGGNGLVFRLQPVAIRLAPDASVTVNASAGPAGYTVSVAGSASPAALLLPARYLPQLGDGLSSVLPFPPTGLTASRVNFLCTHTWGAAQTCTSLRSVAAGKGLPAFPVLLQPPQNQPSLLTPRSLSPFDHASPLGGTPPPLRLPRF